MAARGWKRRVLRGLVGAVAGAALAVGGHLALYRGGLVLPAVAGRLAFAEPAVLLWLVLLGAAFGAAGREILGAAEAAFLPPDLERGPRLLYLAGGLFSLLAVVHYQVVQFILRDPVDLPTFLLAARAIAAGADPYDPAALASMAGGGGAEALPYLYLPLYAVLLGPLAALPMPTASAVFLLLDATLWPLLVYLSFRLIDPPAALRPPLAGLAMVLTASFLPAIQTLHHGSPSLLVAVAAAGALHLERRGKSRSAGLLLALAVLIKVVPVLLLAYLALRRRSRVLLWTAVAAAALLALSVAVAGVDLHVRWVTEVAPGLAAGARTGTWFEPACHPENQSVTGVLCRLLGADVPAVKPLASAIGATLVLLAGLSVGLRRREELPAREASLVFVTMLLGSSITWFHHMTLMLPVGLTVLVAGAERRGAARALLVGAGLSILVAVGFEFLYDPWPFVAPRWSLRAARFFAMLLAYGCLVGLCFAAGRRARRAQGAA